MYFDLQKAFDTVNHKILLQKLYGYGIRGIVHEWFRSYFGELSMNGLEVIYQIVNSLFLLITLILTLTTLIVVSPRDLFWDLCYS